MTISFTQDTPADAPRITAYSGAGGFVVDGIDYPHAILITPQGVSPWQGAADLDFSEQDWANLTDQGADLLLMGCGAATILPSPPLRAACLARGLAIEAMDSRAAARTYNVLIAEGRPVAVALRLV